MKIFLVLFIASVASANNPIIRADGRAQSYVAGNIATHDARSQLFANARFQCTQLGFEATPSLVANSGHCQTYYQNRVWTAHCYSSFRCEEFEETETGLEYGPWRTENGQHEYFFVPGKQSWWRADEACQKLSAMLPSRDELTRDFVYLNATSSIGTFLNEQEGLTGSQYPFANIWTRDIEPNHQAWAFNPSVTTSAITYKMDGRLAAMCIR